MRLRFFLVSSPLQLPDGSVFSFRKKTPDGELPFRNLELSDENWTGLIPRGIPFHRSFFQNLLKTYFEILQIPSASGKESMLRSYLLQKLERIPGGMSEIDGAGNLLFTLPATAPDRMTLCVTAHMDNYLRRLEPMTPEFLFPRIVNGGSSILGGDDKTGVAAFLNWLEIIGDSPVPRGQIQAIFTVHEENLSLRGWSYGARKVSKNFLEGVDLVLAMDVPSGKKIVAPNFLIYHCPDDHPILDLARNVALETGLGPPVFESERDGFIGGDATTFYRVHQLFVLDFATGNYNEHTPSEYTRIPEYFQQTAWLTRLADRLVVLPSEKST